MGECSASSSLQADSKVKELVAIQGLRVGGHLALADFGPDEPQ